MAGETMSGLRALAFELHYQIRRPSSWIAGGAFLLLGGAVSRLSLGGEGVLATGPFSVTLNLALLSLLGVFAATVLVARTGFRDRETGMAEILGATPAAGARLRLNALAGVIATCLLVQSLALAGMAGGAALGADSSPTGGTGPLGYLAAFSLVAVPNTLLLAAILYLVAAASSRPAAVYVSGIGLFLGYFGLSILMGSPLIAGSAAGVGGAPLPVGLADPMGIVPLLESTGHWTAEQMNTRAAWLEPAFLANRAVWAFVTILCVVAAIRAPSLAIGEGRFRSSAAGGGAPGEGSGRLPGGSDTGFRIAPQEPGGWRHAVGATWSTVRVQLGSQVRSVPFLVVAVLWVTLAMMGLVEAVGDGPFDTPFLPSSELVVPALLSPFRLVGSLILIFFASELAWEDRTAGIHPLVDASPVTGGIQVASSILSLAAVSALLVALLQVAGMGYQLVHGGRPDAGLYASLLYFLGLPWVLVGVFTVGVQMISPERHAGMLVAAVVAVASRPLALNLLDVDLPLLPISGPPEIEYSVFAGFEPYLGAFHWHALYGAAAAAVIGVVSAKLWRRGSRTGIAPRLRRLLGSWGRVAGRTGAVGCGALLVTASVIQIGTADQGHLVSEGQDALWRASYERRLSSLASLPLPSVERVDLTLALHPEERRYEVEGSYRLVNRSAVPMDSILVGWNRWVTTRRLTLDGREPATEYGPYNHFLFVPERPLAPGETARLEIWMRTEQTSFGTLDPGHFVTSGGSFLRLERFLPWLGYEPTLTLEDPDLRREHGLEATGGDNARSGDRGRPPEAEFTLTVSAPGGHSVAAPGRLTARSSAGGREAFRFESRGPLPRRYGIAAAPYREERTAAAGRTVRVLHHPRHRANVSVVADAARRTVEELTDLSGPPGAPTLTVAEIPSYGSEGVEATAYPDVVFLREHGGFTGDFGALPEGRLNYLWRRVAHELAHQWWGGRVDPDRAEPGSGLLTEALAEYSAALLVERRFGRAARRKLMRWEEARYLQYRGRLGPTEPALLEATGESPHVARFRGPVVLNAVAGLMGKDELKSLLGEFARRHSGEAAEPPTAEALYRRIRDAVPAERRPLLEQWFRGTAVGDLAIREASVRPLTSGGYEATLQVVREKRGAGDAAEAGNQRGPVPAILEFTPVDDGAVPAGAAPVERETVELLPGVNRVRVVVESEPVRIELDPDVTRIDTNRENNLWTSADVD